MTYTKMRQAIAEKCGWKIIPNSPHGIMLSPDGIARFVPDYPNDINAMYEAEKVLIDHTGYWQWIERIQGPLKFNLVHATARQRAEAFLKVFGLWKD